MLQARLCNRIVFGQFGSLQQGAKRPGNIQMLKDDKLVLAYNFVLFLAKIDQTPMDAVVLE